MKKLLPIIVIVFAIIGGLSFYKFGLSQDLRSGTEHIVELSNDGYSPKDLTIQKGETVKFTTTRDKHFWPASSLHPSHRIYPDFDPQEAIAAEESWSFTFKKVGNWRYHDHISPYFTGEIEVRE